MQFGQRGLSKCKRKAKYSKNITYKATKIYGYEHTKPIFINVQVQ